MVLRYGLGHGSGLGSVPEAEGLGVGLHSPAEATQALCEIQVGSVYVILTPRNASCLCLRVWERSFS